MQKDILKLNSQQLQAMQHIEGPLLVLAGAGSGKTRVVTERISYLLSLGIPAINILAVTFTNKAAREMQERIKSKNQFESRPLICTFHSLGAKILREKIHLLGYRNNFSIYDEEDVFKLLRTCLKHLGMENVKEMRLLISKAKNDLSFQDLFDSTDGHKKQDFLKAFELYQTRLKEYNAVDFDDLLYLTVNLLKNSPETKKIYQKRWQFLLIDEYQDTNYAQHELTLHLADRHKNIFAVGDPDQSIYSWRGARYKNILNFEKLFPGSKTITLKQNYRSCNLILKAANAVIANNENRKHKELFSELGEGEKINSAILDTDKEEALFIIQKISQLKKTQALSLNDISIFYRTNAQSRIFEDLLLTHQIPYVIYGGISFYQRKEIKDVLAYLKLIVSDSDFLSFARTVNLPKRGIGETSLNKLLYLSEKSNLPILKLLENVLQNPHQFSHIKIGQKQQTNLKGYLDLIYKLREKLNQKITLFDLISELLEKSGYLDFLKEDKEKFWERKENLEELIAKASEYDESNKENPLISFLEELSLLSSLDANAHTQDTLKLMTLHHGKGLEFDTVFISGLEEDLFPHINSKNSIEKLEEERRLFYVGITRAKKRLFLTVSSCRFLFGAQRFMLPSRFLGELPQELVENMSTNVYSGKSHFFSGLGKKSFSRPLKKETCQENLYVFEKEDKKAENTEKFNPGDLVEHSLFGIGTIIKAYSCSFGLAYDIFFKKDKIQKTLAAKYAKLKPVGKI